MTFVFALALSSTQSAQITPPQAVSSPPPGLVSETPAHGASMPVLSGDGRRVAFVSRAPNLVTNPTSGSYQIFLRDLFTGSLTLVSVTRDRKGGNGHSLLPALDVYGFTVAFESDATDLVPNDTNGVSDIFVRELSHRQTWRLGGNGPSRNPMLSAEGYVAFESHASNLVPGDNNNAQDVFFQHVVEPPVLVSVNMAGTASANGQSHLLAITPNGRFVVFWSDATDISSGTSSLGEVYVRDAQNGITYCLTKSIYTYDGRRTFKVAITPDGAFAALQELHYAGGPPDGRVFRVNVFASSVTNIYTYGRPGSGLAISEDGTRVIFPGNNGLYHYESSTGTELLIQDNPILPVMPLTIDSFLVSKDFRRLWFTRLTNAVHQLYAYDLDSNDGAFLNGLISTNNLGQPLKSGVISPFSISDAGLTAAYETSSGDVETNDFNVAPDVFVGNARAALNNSRLISARHPELPSTTGVGHTTLHPTALNANGTRIAFLSSDSPLTLNDTNGYNDVFVRDFAADALLTFDGVARTNSVLSPILSADGQWLAMELFTGEERLTSFTERGFLSRADLRTAQIQILGGPNAAGSNPHWSPSLSQEGRWLVFRDGDRIRITDLRTPPVPGQASNVIVDVGLSGPFIPPQANGPSSTPRVSLDGEWVVYVSRASNLMPSNDGSGSGPYPPGVPQIFALKFWQGSTRLVTIAPSGSPLPAGGTNPVISANTRFVAFETYTGSNIYRHDLLARGPITNVLVCSSCSRPAISGDGRFVLYQNGGQLYVRDVQNEGTQSIGAAGASDAILSIDGRFVAFVQSGQVYLHDRWTQATHLLSRNVNGDGGNAPSSRPVFSHDGRTVAFQSFASDLVSGDYNRRRDIFIVRIQPVDTDSDGMDDDWEEYRFASLAQDGSADVDADQHTDRQEFLAGTDPRDPSSVLRLRTSARRSAPWVLHPEIKWTSAPGRTYRLQHTPDLSLPWTDVQEFLTGGFNAATPSPGAGLYRMKLTD